MQDWERVLCPHINVARNREKGTQNSGSRVGDLLDLFFLLKSLKISFGDALIKLYGMINFQ